jgi:DNA polymerase bacteriophage-type
VCNIACEFDKFCRYSRGETEDGSVSESGGKKGAFKPNAEPLPILGDIAPPPNDSGPSPSADEPPRSDPIPGTDDPVVDDASSEPEHDPNFDDLRPGDDNSYVGDGKPHTLIFDFETRSAADLKLVGAQKYAADPTTDVWCAAYCVDDGPVQVWTPGRPVPAEFVEAAANPNWKVVAFNASFDRAIAAHVMCKRYGWPSVPLERHACLQAASLAHALPASLGGVASALSLAEEKDEVGKRLMREMARPRRATLEEDPNQLYWHDDPDRLQRLAGYCGQDVVTTRAIHARIGLLPTDEQKVWLLDQKINDRGIRIDRKLAEGAARIAASASAVIDAEIEELTNGEVASARQVSKLLAFLAAQGVALDRARVEDVDEVLKRTDLSPTVRRVFELRRDGAHIAGAKPSAMLAQAGDGDRVRGCFRYHGAATGRWTAHGVQPQNMKKPNGLDITAAIGVVSAGDYEQAKRQYENPLSVVGSITRAAIVAAPGHRLIAADFSGIESRVLAWLAGEHSKLKIWSDFDAARTAESDPYLVLGKRMGFADDTARATGKIADLAFGFGGGLGAYRRLGDAATSDEDVGRLKQAWRAAHPKIAAKPGGLWHTLERAVKRAIAQPNKVTRANDKLVLCYDSSFLRMKLPSSRCIAFPFPWARDGVNKFGKAETVVGFMDNKGGKWGTVTKPGGEEGAWLGNWIENAVQGVARDLLAAGMMRLEAAGYPIVLHVHDEIVAEMPDDFGSEQEFVRIITELPNWAEGLPVGAKVRSGPRFCEIDSAKVEQPMLDEAPDEALPPWEESEVGDREAPSAPPRPSAAAASAPSVKTDPPRPSSWSFEGYFAGEEETGAVVATYVYRDAGGREVMKKIKRRTAAGKNNFPVYILRGDVWRKAKRDELQITVPYRLPELIAADPKATVFVAEGEKDAETLAALGRVATTGCFGAVKWDARWSKWFEGRAHVVVLEDNDDHGRAFAKEVARHLGPVVKRLQIVGFAGEVAEKGDVMDWLSAGHTREELLARCAAAPDWKVGLPFIDMSRWDDEPAPEQEWVVDSRIPVRQTAILSGEGGGGKSTAALHLCCACALGREWLLSAVRRGPSIFVDAEDDDDAIQRRLEANARYFGAKVADFIRGGLHIVGLAGQDAVLATFSRSGRIEPTERYQALLEAAGDIRPSVIAVASVGNAFAGNENDRSQVQQFEALMKRVAILAGGSVVLVSHPSLAGIASGTGLSGSTQWHNAVRARAYMKIVKTRREERDDSSPEDTGVRELAFQKIQYGAPVPPVILRYQSGLFLPEPSLVALSQEMRELRAKEVFMDLLRRYAREGRNANHSPGKGYAPSDFAKGSPGGWAQQACLGTGDASAPEGRGHRH